MSKRKPSRTVKCDWCGKKTTPGPLVQHRKVCPKRPNPHPYTVEQPVAACKWGCGLVTTVGALATHERYGCELRPEDGGDARMTCEFCGDVTTMPGAMTRHWSVCSKNPANMAKSS